LMRVNDGASRGVTKPLITANDFVLDLYLYLA
jgi:hypothetical protein